jgi:hypothetical protein
MRRAAYQRVAVCYTDAVMPEYKECDVFSKLVRALETETDARGRQALYECIAVLQESRLCKPLLRDAGAVPALVDSLAHEHDDKLQSACSACIAAM